MHVSAILLVNEHGGFEEAAIVGGTKPCLAATEILGASTVERTVNRFKAAGVTPVSVVGPREVRISRIDGVEYSVADHPETFLKCAGESLQKLVRLGSNAILIAQLGVYAEVDVRRAIDFHKQQRRPVTRICGADGALGWWIVDASQLSAMEKLALPLGKLTEELETIPYVDDGYVNRLRDFRDARQLVVDAFNQSCGIVPQGQEVRPGIWIHPRAEVKPNVRIVAPAYIGRGSVVSSGAIVAAFSSIESNCNVGAETVLSGSTVLANTAVGFGLDINDCVISGSDLFDLRRNAAITIYDSSLLKSTARVRRRNLRAPSADYSPEDRRRSTMRMLYPAWRASVEAFKGEI